MLATVNNIEILIILTLFFVDNSSRPKGTILAHFETYTHRIHQPLSVTSIILILLFINDRCAIQLVHHYFILEKHHNIQDA